MKQKGTKDLTLTQRREIENHLKSGCSKKRIAELLGVCRYRVQRIKTR